MGSPIFSPGIFLPKLIGRTFYEFYEFKEKHYPNERINVNPLKPIIHFIHSFLLLIVLLTVVSCGCANPAGPDNGNNPTNPTLTTPTNYVLVERPLYIVSVPENSLTRTISIDTNILDLYLSSGYNADDFSITHLNGVDVVIIDTNALDIDLNDKTISGTIKLNQRLDFENPIDRGENSGDNDYEVVLFRVMSETSSNDFKLIVRITDTADPKKLEILIDSFHLDDVNQQRGIRELYLYEDSGAIAPILGDDSNNFLTSNLIEDIYVWGEVEAYTDLSQLYDQNDRIDAFLTKTTVNSNSNTYHRLIIDFTEELYIEKVAIRGRQVGGYYGFVFILRDKNDHIIYVHQASNPFSQGSGFDAGATTTYDFVADYAHFTPISDFNIKLNNNFDGIEGSTNIISDNNFSVSPGYEYERGFVSIEPGADIDKFNTNDVFFIENELRGLSLKIIPDYENPTDANSNNVFELGRVTITNVDGGHTNFDLRVGVFDIPSAVFLLSNSVNYTVSIYTSNVIDNLLDLVDGALVDLSGDVTYNYELSGPDADYFQVSLNTVKTKDRFGFRSIYENDGVYEFEVTYVPDDDGSNQVLEVRVQMDEPGWREITSSAPWKRRTDFQSVVLNNNDVLVMGGNNYHTIIYSDVWRSSDGGTSWSLITASAPWAPKDLFETVVLANNDILLIGNVSNDVWLSSDGGFNWTNIVVSAPWNHEYQLQTKDAVVLNGNEILLLGSTGRNYHNWISGDGGFSWNKIGDAPWYGNGIDYARLVKPMVLNNGDILNIFPTYNYTNGKIWKSENGGTNWDVIDFPFPWSGREGFHAVALPNDNILILGGFSYYPIADQDYNNDVWISKDGGVNWLNITPNDHWNPRAGFEAVFVPHKGTLVMGGNDNHNLFSSVYTRNDVWLREEYNRHYLD